MGANVKDPTPAPPDVMQLANDSLLLKYFVTMTTDGRYMRPNPIPMVMQEVALRSQTKNCVVTSHNSCCNEQGSNTGNNAADHQTTCSHDGTNNCNTSATELFHKIGCKWPSNKYQPHLGRLHHRSGGMFSAKSLHKFTQKYAKCIVNSIN